MNLFEDIFWKLMNSVHSLLGVYLIDYVETEKFSKLKNIYLVISHVTVMTISVYVTNWSHYFEKTTYFDVLFAMVVIEEIIVLAVLMLTEISINLAVNDEISQNIKIIDDFLKHDEFHKTQFKTKLTNFYFFYLFFTITSNVIDYIKWGYNFWLIFVKSKIYDFSLLKFLVMMHMHLCRLFTMNNHLRHILKSKLEENCNWLTSWKFLPKRLEIYGGVEDLDNFLLIYSTLCENLTIISKKYHVYVSKS